MPANGNLFVQLHFTRRLFTIDRLKDKVAIITGSTGGIGLRTAELFASEGAKVVVTGRRVAVGEEVAKKIREDGGEAIYHPLDIGIRESIETLFADTERTYGKIDILVNNAANLRLADGRVDEITDEMWDDVVDNDLKGPFWSCRAVLPYMRKQKGGSIVNIGSMASDESSFVTGQIITVDGGLNAHVTTVAQFRNAGSCTW